MTNLIEAAAIATGLMASFVAIAFALVQSAIALRAASKAVQALRIECACLQGECAAMGLRQTDADAVTPKLWFGEAA